jgi:hypothetical protein
VTTRKDEGMIDLEKLRQEEFKEVTIDEQMEIISCLEEIKNIIEYYKDDKDIPGSLKEWLSRYFPDTRKEGE